MIKTEGHFDLSQSPVYFIAGVDFLKLVVMEKPYPTDTQANKFMLAAVNEIGAGMEGYIEESQERGVNWLIDSGIFNLTNEHKRKHGITMDEALALAPDEIEGFDDLFEKYIRIIDKFRDKCWGYIELDQGGRENKIKTRTRLEDLGYRPIPVFHPLNDGWDYFHYLAQRYDRICLGNVVQANKFLRVEILSKAWELHQQYPHMWIHVLGYTPDVYFHAYPFNSCDSSSWITSARFGRGSDAACLRNYTKRGVTYIKDIPQTDRGGYMHYIRIPAITAHHTNIMMTGDMYRNYKYDDKLNND